MSLSKLCFAIATFLFLLSALATDFLNASGRRDEWGFVFIALGLFLSGWGWVFPARGE